MRRIIAACALFASLCSGAVSVVVPEDFSGMGVVSWSQKQASDGNCLLSLVAKPSAGFSFAGWTVNDAEPEWGVDARTPSVSGVLVDSNATVSASFVAFRDDTLQFDFADLFSDLAYGEQVSIALDVDSVSFPTLAFRGLPDGLVFDSKSLEVRGTPKSPCRNKVVVTGKNGSGYQFKQEFHSSVRDISSARLTSKTIEIPLGEYYHEEFDSLFDCTDERVSTTLAGVPSDLTWKSDWDLLYGTPTKSGVYVLKATVKFADDRVEVATTRLVVSGPDPEEHGVDFGGLSEMAVGDVLEAGDVVLGTYEGKTGILSVSGLPDGLSVKTWTEEGAKFYGVAGRVRTAGLYTVVAKVAEFSGDSITNVVVEQEIAVEDTPNSFLSVSVSEASPEGSGTVTGGGVVSVASGTSVSARAAAGYVFAGWRDAYDEPSDVGEGKDYRSPSVVYDAGTEYSNIELFALFAPAAEDSEMSVASLDGEKFVFSADEGLDEEFEVVSLSLPVLTAKGLPQGVSIVPSSDNAYRLSYDPETSARTPSPGRYHVMLQAKNKSGVSDSAAFVLQVANLVDSRVNVKDDYGDFTPGEEIVPIDLSSAVDFDSGESISVSGLPRGLVFNKTANDKKGIAAETITGAPSQPGDYTITFKATVVASATTNSQGRVAYTYETAVATAFLTVLPYPLVEVDMDEDALAAGNTVSGGGNYKPGTKVTLKAKAAKDWVFAGWDGVWDIDGIAMLAPTLSIVSGSTDQGVWANFVHVSEDRLSIAEPVATEAGFAAEFPLNVEVSEGDNASLLADIVESVSYPTVKVTGLPSGIKFSASDLMLSGKPSKSGVYYVTVSAKNAGGYSFTRILRMAVLDKDGAVPTEPALDNAAGLDFSPLQGLVTGRSYGYGDLGLAVGPSPDSGAAPVKATVTGVPQGLKYAVVENEDGLAVLFYGVPTKVVRASIAVKVTYADKKTLTSKVAVIVEDGGSAYLSVRSLDDSMGTAAGSGVYSAGQTVKLVANPKSKCVFAGWHVDSEIEGMVYYGSLAEKDGIDPRNATASFPFRPLDLSGVGDIWASFVPSADDLEVTIGLAEGTWEIEPDKASEFGFSVESRSLPALTAKNLPKGVSVDLARGKLVYTPDKSVKSGIYHAKLSAKNKSNASASLKTSGHIAVSSFSSILTLQTFFI